MPGHWLKIKYSNTQSTSKVYGVFGLICWKTKRTAAAAPATIFSCWILIKIDKNYYNPIQSSFVSYYAQLIKQITIYIWCSRTESTGAKTFSFVYISILLFCVYSCVWYRFVYTFVTFSFDSLSKATTGEKQLMARKFFCFFLFSHFLMTRMSKCPFGQLFRLRFSIRLVLVINWRVWQRKINKHRPIIRVDRYEFFALCELCLH